MVEATVRGVHRGTILSDPNFHVEAHTAASASEPTVEVERTAEPVYSFVIDHPEGTILVDTGSHPAAGEGHWPAPLYDAFEHVDADEHPLDADLERIGYAVSDIDYVVQTHLHVDHAGGLHHFAGTDVPVFVHEGELQFAYFSAATNEGSSGYVQADFDHDIDWRVVSHHRTEYFDGVEFLHLPGHAPGLLGLLVHLEDETLLFASDVAEFPVHLEGVPQGAGLLHDRQAWEDSVARLRDLQRRHDATVIYGHDPDQREEIAEGWE